LKSEMVKFATYLSRDVGSPKKKGPVNRAFSRVAEREP
jgi:hypothetical protein